MQKRVLLVMAASVALVSGAMALPITDNFDDTTMTSTPAGIDWLGDVGNTSGVWHANAGQVWGDQDGAACTTAAGAVMTADFGGDYTDATVEFDISQANGTGASYRMEMGFGTTDGRIMWMEMSPEEYRYLGDTSITSYDGLWNIIGIGSADNPNPVAQQRLPRSEVSHMKFVFDLGEPKFIVRTYIDGTYAAYMEQHINTPVAGVDSFHIKNRDGVVTWRIDNFSAVPEPMSLSLLALGGLFLRRRSA